MRSAAWRTFPRAMLVARYVRRFKRVPHLRAPRTFTEKVLVKLLFDRDPRLTLFADKFAVREYVKRKLGGEEHLTALFAHVDSAAAIGELALPDRFVMKPNHLSQAVRIVLDIRAVERAELEALARAWLSRNYGVERGEWAYRDIRPRVLFEELLESGGRPPSDYRIYCFAGEPRFVRVTRDFGAHPTGTFYDTDFRPLPVTLVGSIHRPSPSGVGPPPPNFDRMLDIARALADDVDFVRVDLYNLDGRVIFGELTNYPQAGTRTFDPPAWDLTFGSYWPRRRPQSSRRRR